MEITDVRVRKVGGDGKMKAVASVTFDNDFVVHDIKIIEGQNGMVIAIPSRKTLDGEYRDIAHPINSDMRARLQDLILKQYDQLMQNRLQGEKSPLKPISIRKMDFKFFVYKVNFIIDLMYNVIGFVAVTLLFVGYGNNSLILQVTGIIGM